MFKLSIMTPEKRVLLDQEIASVTIPLTSGEVQILPGHVPMIATLGTGVLKYKAKGADVETRLMISWGYCEVSHDGIVVLAETTKTKSEVVQHDEQTKITQNQAKLLTEVLDDVEFNATTNEIQKSQANLQLI